MKKYKGIVQSITEPSIEYLWQKGNKLLYFSGNGWSEVIDILEEEEIENLISDSIKDKLDTSKFNSYVKSNDSKVSSLDKKVTELQNKLDTMQNTISKMEKDILALQEEVNKPKE